MFLHLSVSHSVHRRVCMVAGGVRGCGGLCHCRGACMVTRRHAWLQGACVVVGGSVHGCRGGMRGCRGACMVVWGGVCGCWGCVWFWGRPWLWGACVVAGGHVWLQGGMHGCGGACVVVGGHVWLLGGMHGCGGACMGYDKIQSMSGWYTSYWNAFLLIYLSFRLYSPLVYPGTLDSWRHPIILSFFHKSRWTCTLWGPWFPFWKGNSNGFSNLLHQTILSVISYLCAHLKVVYSTKLYFHKYQSTVIIAKVLVGRYLRGNLFTFRDNSSP